MSAEEFARNVLSLSQRYNDMQERIDTLTDACAQMQERIDALVEQRAQAMRCVQADEAIRRYVAEHAISSHHFSYDPVHHRLLAEWVAARRALVDAGEIDKVSNHDPA